MNFGLYLANRTASSRRFLPHIKVFPSNSVLLGRGVYGKVWLIHDDRSGQDVAVKQISTISEMGESLLGELSMCNLALPNLVTLQDWGYDDHSHYFIMPVMKPLSKILRNEDCYTGIPLEVEEVLKLAVDLMRAVLALNSLNRCHRDIKSQNVLYDTSSDSYYLGDFGMVNLPVSRFYLLCSQHLLPFVSGTRIC
ncbi:hypothetical protein RCL1_004816 [Eukaryota sp. TZLM3-RCL]